MMKQASSSIFIARDVFSSKIARKYNYIDYIIQHICIYSHNGVCLFQKEKLK